MEIATAITTSVNLIDCGFTMKICIRVALKYENVGLRKSMFNHNNNCLISLFISSKLSKFVAIF